MAQLNVLVCDGCEQVGTTRRPVYGYTLSELRDGEQDMAIEADAHDWNCFGRVISRRRKAERVAKAAGKPEGKKSKN